MKKIMIALVAVAIAAVSQAASVDWKLSSDFKNKTYYVFNGDYNSSIVAALGDTTNGGADAFADFVAGLDASSYATGTVASRGSSGKFADTAAANLTFLVFDSTIEADNTYQIYTASTDGFTYTTGTPTGNLTPAASNFASGTIAAAPEPTSGLLLLIGVAGLALRRRRA